MPVPDSPTLAREDLGFLSGSDERLEVLTELQEDSLTPAELRERTGVSPETIQKLLDAGIGRNWITKKEPARHYTLTVAGDLLLQTYLDTNILDRELLAFLANSATHLRVLGLLENEPLSPTELDDRIPVSHPTVYRTLHRLEDRGLIDWTEKPELVSDGVDVYTAYRRLADVAQWTADHAEVLNHLGDTARTIPAQTLAQDSTEVVVNSIAHPDAVLDRFETRLEELSPERIRGVLPSMCKFVDRMRRSLLEQGTELNIVLDEAVLEVARTSYPKILDSIAGGESNALFVYPEKLRFGLAVLGSAAFVFVYDERSLIASIETTSDSFSTWAANTFQAHHRAAYILNN